MWNEECPTSTSWPLEFGFYYIHKLSIPFDKIFFNLIWFGKFHCQTQWMRSLKWWQKWMKKNLRQFMVLSDFLLLLCENDTSILGKDIRPTECNFHLLSLVIHEPSLNWTSGKLWMWKMREEKTVRNVWVNCSTWYFPVEIIGYEWIFESTLKYTAPPESRKTRDFEYYFLIIRLKHTRFLRAQYFSDFFFLQMVNFHVSEKRWIFFPFYRTPP